MLMGKKLNPNQFTRAPMGLSPSGDYFNMKTDKVISGMDGVLKSVDDLLFQGENIEQLEERLDEFFLRCKVENIQISEKKFKASSKN